MPLGIRLGRAGSLPLLLLLREEEEERELPARCRRPFPASPMLLTLPSSHRTFHDVRTRGSHQHLAPAFYPPAVHALRSVDRGRIRGLGHVRLARVDVAVALALAPLPVRGQEVVSVLGLIREFHDMAEPASVPAARCKTSLASAYGLMSESSPAFTLPVSPLLSTLLLDINSDLSKFLEDQTVHGFLPVPGRRHRRYYGTSTSSFPGPYTVPPGVTSITLEKASEVKKRSVSLSASQLSSMETMLSGMCEVSSWLDWWLSTCGGFRDHLLVEVRADFERLMISGSRALEFLASQGCMTLGNLVLSR